MTEEGHLKLPEPGSWLETAITALRQWLCPNHFRPLLASGWCLWCHCWYDADFLRQIVIARYPMPAVGLDPELQLSRFIDIVGV